MVPNFYSKEAIEPNHCCLDFEEPIRLVEQLVCLKTMENNGNGLAIEHSGKLAKSVGDSLNQNRTHFSRPTH
jgi:hypothetical protein